MKNLTALLSPIEVENTPKEGFCARCGLGTESGYPKVNYKDVLFLPKNPLFHNSRNSIHPEKMMLEGFYYFLKFISFERCPFFEIR